MGAASTIEWTDATWNPVRGCTRVSEGCRNCYAERVAARFSGPDQPYEGCTTLTPHGPRWTGRVRLVLEALSLPLTWRKPRRIFVNSMSDLFHEELSDADIDRVFAVMALAPQHTFQVLTKRPERMRDYLTSPQTPRRVARAILDMALADPKLFSRNPWPVRSIGSIDRPNDVTVDFPLPNVWLGTSIEDQATADARVPILLDTPAAVRFVSYEPALGAVDASPWVFDRDRAIRDAMNGPAALNQHQADAAIPRPLDLVIMGGESGPGARTWHGYIDAARSLRDQCAAAGVAFHYKQHGEWISACQVRHLPDGGGPGFGAYDHCHFDMDAQALRVGKKAAGRLLDGVEHNGMPDHAG